MSDDNAADSILNSDAQKAEKAAELGTCEYRFHNTYIFRNGYVESQRNVHYQNDFCVNWKPLAPQAAPTKNTGCAQCLILGGPCDAHKVVNQAAPAEKMAAPVGETEMRWIPCSERLPAAGSAVMFWTKADCWESGFFRPDDERGEVLWIPERTNPQDEPIKFYEHEVTHWMIPATPKAAVIKN